MTAAFSMLPVAELRFGLPYGLAIGLPWHLAYIAAVAGNILPVPFIILFIRPLFTWLKKKTKLGGLVHRLEKKAFRHADKVYKYKLLGLFLLVAVPLPGTGAWTGALVAAVLDLRLKYAVLVILAGVLAAGVAVSIIAGGFAFVF